MATKTNTTLFHLSSDDKAAANIRFAARLARRCCNQQQIFNQQRPRGDLYKLSLVSLQVQFFNPAL